MGKIDISKDREEGINTYKPTKKEEQKDMFTKLKKDVGSIVLQRLEGKQKAKREKIDEEIIKLCGYGEAIRDIKVILKDLGAIENE
jgi:hypothetical protein